MLRVLTVALGIVLLMICAWVFLSGDGAGEFATAPGRESVPAEDSGGRPEVAGAPIEGSREAAGVAAAAEIPATKAAAAAPLTGVLAGWLAIDGAPLAEAIELRLEPADESAHADTRGTLRTDAFGRFRRDGLPADWSGELWLPAPYRIEHGEGSWSTVLAVERLRDDLVIEVERPPALLFRVLRADHTPVPEVSVRVEQHESSGSRDDRVRTDAAGRGRHPQSSPRPHTVVVRARAGDGGHVTARFGQAELLASEPLGDTDLGDLILAQGRTVELRCVEPDGSPVVRTRVRVREADTLEVHTADEQGVIRLGLPLDSVDLRLEVDGYLAAFVEVSAGAGCLDVVLRRASLLRVEVVDTHGRPWANGRLSLVASRPPFGEGNHWPPGFRGRYRAALRVAGDSEVVHVSEFGLDAEGAVEIPGIEVGLEVELQASDELGHVGARNRASGLAEAERRVVRMQLDREPCALEARVLDLGGRPIAGAQVNLSSGPLSLSQPTGDDDSIRFESLFAPRLTVSASAAGLQPARVPAIDPCTGPIALTLLEGRTLMVDLRDEADHAVGAGQLTLQDRSGKRSLGARDTQLRFEGLPFEPLVLVWTLCGRERRLEVDASQESVEFVLPILGEVQVAIDGWTPVEREFLWLRVESQESLVPDCGSLPLAAARQPVALWPGRYRLSAWVYRVEPPNAGERRLGEPSEVLVEAGASVEVTFGP